MNGQNHGPGRQRPQRWLIGLLVLGVAGQRHRLPWCSDPARLQHTQQTATMAIHRRETTSRRRSSRRLSPAGSCV